MTYLYEIIATGERFEVEQRISEPAHTALDVDGVSVPVKRLISGAPGFNLVAGASGGWASTGYSKPEHERRAEQTLGRPLVKAAR